MTSDSMGWGRLTSNLQLGEVLQIHRTLLHKYLQLSAVRNYEMQETIAIHRLLGDLLDSPRKFFDHIKRSLFSARSLS